MKFYNRLLNVIHTGAAFLSMIFLVILVVIIFIHVVLRYVFNSGLLWSEEIASYVLLPAMVFIGMALGVEEKLHINIDILPRKLPAWLDMVLIKLKYILMLIIGIVLMVYSIQFIMLNIEYGNFLPSTGWNNSMQYIMMPLCGVLIILFSAFYCIKEKREPKFLDSFLEKEKKMEIEAESMEISRGE